MKRIASLLTLVVIAFNMAGIFFVFKVRQLQVKMEIRQQLEAGAPEDQLQRLPFTPAEKENLEWADEEEEFRYQGHMYDVVRWEQHGDTTVYYCINDTEESYLFTCLDELVKKKMEEEQGSHKSPAGKLLKVSVSEAYLAAEYSATPLNTYRKNKHFTTYTELYHAPGLDPVSPPPECA